jgi:hypothetical protein
MNKGRGGGAPGSGCVSCVAWSRQLDLGEDMALRILLVLAAFAVLYGCGQESSPVEKQ